MLGDAQTGRYRDEHLSKVLLAGQTPKEPTEMSRIHSPK
jgi:hypothetical protein